MAEKINVPSDPRAAYFLESLKGCDDGMIIVLNRRLAPRDEKGKREVSYACRAILPEEGIFKYLGEGESLQEVEAQKRESRWVPLIAGSISADVCRFAADRFARKLEIRSY